MTHHDEKKLDLTFDVLLPAVSTRHYDTRVYTTSLRLIDCLHSSPMLHQRLMVHSYVLLLSFAMKKEFNCLYIVNVLRIEHKW